MVSNKNFSKQNKGLTFVKTMNDGLFKTMRHNRNSNIKNSVNNNKTKANATSHNLYIKDFKPRNVSKTVKQPVSQFNTSNINRLLRQIKGKSPDSSTENHIVRSRDPKQELTTKLIESSKTKVRFQNQNSMNITNGAVKSPDSHLCLLNKIKNRIVSKKSITSHSHLANK